ncbi:MAG TPA: ATP-binding protein [Gemmataceae bacterium]|nr:ATP-binding protein [Gemmataceae bacterium]
MTACVRDAGLNFLPSFEDRPDARVPHDIEAVVCFVGRGEDEEPCLRRVQEVIDGHPYVPVVVVLAPGIPRERFHALHVAHVLNTSDTADGPFPLAQQVTLLKVTPMPLPGDGLASVARVVADAIKDAWWRAADQLRVSSMVVGEDGTILRANDFAAREFGAAVIGMSYAVAVEGGAEPGLPDGHPIREAIATGRAVSRYHERLGRDNKWHRAYLVCTPLRGLSKEVRAVVVLVREVNQWTRIFNAASSLSRADTPEKLWQTIVEEARLLGYRRARLKQYAPDEGEGGLGRLYGRASVGLDDSVRHYYQSAYFIDRAGRDAIAFDALDKELPLLFVPKDDPTFRTHSELVRFFDPADRPQEKVVGNDHSRWIDVPVLVPVGGEGGATSTAKWGVLTIDLGPDSHRLDLRDAADLAAFASIVGAAIGEMNRRQDQHRQHLTLFRKYTRWLVTTLRDGHVNPVRPAVMNRLLDLYLEITRAEVVLYRERHGDSLALAGYRWRDREPHPDYLTIPQVIRKGEGFSAKYLEGLGPDGALREGAVPEPVVNNDAAAQVLDDLSRGPEERFSMPERELLHFRSAAYIPLVARGRLCGTVVALSREPGAFTTNLELLLKRFTDSASLWVELAELHDGKVWWDHILRDVVAVLPRLALTPRRPLEEGFFGGLATLLSARDGLGWNRVLIFTCNGPEPYTAELAYALGGLGAAEHLGRQKAAAEAYADKFGELVEKRLKSPAPVGDDGGPDSLDPLYDLCVRRPREGGNPIRIPYGFSDPNRPAAPGRPGPAETHPLQWMLDQDHTNFIGPDGAHRYDIPSKLKRTGWLADMDRDYRGMFCAETTYAFPLWCAYDHSPAPLGLVLVDMAYEPGKRVDDTIDATRVVLDLAADILASRHHERRLRGWLGVLPEILHPAGGTRNFKALWDDFYSQLNRLLRAVGRDGGGAPRSEAGQADLLAAVRATDELLAELKQSISGYLKGQAAARQRMNSGGRAVIRDLGGHLARLAAAYEAHDGYKGFLHFDLRCEAGNGLDLPCDPDIFRDALHCLVENAVEAARGGRRPGVTVRVEAERRPVSGAFETVLTLRVSDDGPGIAEEIASYLFLSGFSSRPASPPPAGEKHGQRGRGLAVARSQLFSCHGDLQFEPPPAAGARRPGDRLPAVFTMRFGIPRASPRGAGEKSHDQAADNRRQRATEGSDPAGR